MIRKGNINHRQIHFADDLLNEVISENLVIFIQFYCHYFLYTIDVYSGVSSDIFLYNLFSSSRHQSLDACFERLNS